MFGDRLKELRKNKNMSMEDLVSQYNLMFDGRLNKSTISRYENNLQEPMFNVAKNLARFFCVPVGLLTGEELSPGLDILSLENVIPMPKTKKVPLVGTIACGTPVLAEENIEDYIHMPEHMGGTFALKCKGDSMINARIFDGDIVYIREQPDVDDGDIAAVRIGDEATLKKVYRYPNKLVLRACNPTFDDIIYSHDELNIISIIGKAVAFISVVR